MKGFKDSNNKFHPITQSKGVRKSRDQTAKTIGIRLKRKNSPRRKCECHNTEKLCYIHEVRILPESKEIWEGNSPSARLKLLGREKGNAKIAKLKWEDVPDNKKLKFSTGIEDWSAKIG